MRCRSSFSIHLFFFAMKISSVISDIKSAVCINESKYTNGSTYSTNLNQVMTDLLRNTPQSSGFNTTSSGETPDKVYGLLQCIGTVSAERCSECAQQAINSLKENCTNDMGGMMLMDDCFLRYDNFDLSSQLDFTPYWSYHGNNISGNMDDFNATTSRLLSDLSTKAYDPARKGLATGSTMYSQSDKVYGLVQCWRDLSIENCNVCLSAARNKLKNCCDETQGEECCSVKEGAQAMSESCTVRFDIYQFFNPSSKSSPPIESKKKSSKTLHIILGVAGGLNLALLICLIAMGRGRGPARFAGLANLVTHNEERPAYFSELELPVHDQKKIIISLEELAEATHDFHENNKLGEGGFGPGTTRDGKEIAVKKLSARSRQGNTEFMNEVKLMVNLNNRNLVKLLRCCAERDERLLVYEYFPNKSLDTFLFDPEKRTQLDWQKRYNIILGIARGLLYLHEDSHLRIIHRDIKASNIMLDAELKPKIADFGLARLFPENKTQIRTELVAGTYGYMAPEYAMGGQLSVKADVYSFGVLLLEIVSGRKITDGNLPDEIQNLLEWAWRLYTGGDVLTMVESTVVESSPREQVIRCIQVGLLCVQADARVRPNMWKVVTMISSSSGTLPDPTRPWPVNLSEPSPVVGPASSVNGTSITDVAPR